LIAEEHAPAAVQLLLNIMNGNYPIKVRMEAAAKVLMIAGTGFRGEVRDAQGRPAANGNFKLNAKDNNRPANTALIRAALKTLPEGAIKYGPEEVAEGEKVVMLHNPIYKTNGNRADLPIGGVFKGKPDGEVFRGGQQKPIIELETDEQEDFEEEAGYF